MKRIALVTPMLQPYRISFYEKLASANTAYEFCIFHGVSTKEDGRPNFKGNTSFNNQGLKENKYFLGPFKIVYNQGLVSKIKQFNPDLVILQGIAGDISNRLVVNWAYTNRKKIILWTCGWEPGLAKGKLLYFKNSLVSTFFKKANLHLTYSTKASSYAESMGVLPEKIRVSYNGIEIDQLLEQEDQILEESKNYVRKFKLDKHITFLYVGGLIPEKRVDLLLHAFSELRKEHRNIKLILIGDGPIRDQITSQIDNLSDPNIYYLGRIIDGVDPYFAASDCLVLPGVGGLSLNQAMFWRKPCIVSEADGTEDDLVIDNETGFRFEKDDLRSLTDAMKRRVTLTPEQESEMSEKARDIITSKSNVNNMVNVFLSGIDDCFQNKF